jgi:dihydrofolate reductase
MDRVRGIGKGNRLPWRLSSDLKRFKELTMGHHVIVGRKTFESIGRPLPGRTMIVVTRNAAYKPGDCLIACSLEEALAIADGRGDDEAFVSGGAEIYGAALPLADRMYVTRVDAEVDADVFFPYFNTAEWKETEIGRHEAGEKNQYAFTFVDLERVK